MKTMKVRGDIILPVLLVLLISFLSQVVDSAETTAQFSKTYAQDGTAIQGEQLANSITLSVKIPKVGLSKCTGPDGKVYDKVTIPDVNLLTQEEGTPQLPYISEKLWVPSQATNVFVQAKVNGTPVTYQDILVYPCPKTVVKTDDKGYSYLDREFFRDPNKYQNMDLLPQATAVIRQDGYFRSLRMIQLDIYPVRYKVGEKVLETVTDLTITITWQLESTMAVKKDATKGFEKTAPQLVLNYAAYQKSQEGQPKVETTVVRSASLPAGSVTYITGSQLRDAGIACDYLIVTHPDFYSSPALNDFAQYRADHSGLNIVVAKVDDIYAQFPNANGNDYSVKDFVEYAYSNCSTPPQYLLLAGDIEYVPTHKLMPENETYEEWYVCVSGPDQWPDMAMGRFTVKNESDIIIMKDKTISYEQNPILANDYHKRALFLSAGWKDPVITNDLINSGFELTELYEPDYDTSIDVIGAINNGQGLVYNTSHGSSYGFSMFCTQNINDLHNLGVYPIMLIEACDTARLEDGIAPSVGKSLVKAENKGAVAYYGGAAQIGNAAGKEILSTIFDDFEYDLGKAILIGKNRYYSSVGTACASLSCVLLGDPALRVFGYEVNHGLPDLAIPSSGIYYDYRTHTLTLEAANIGEADANNVKIRCFIVDNVTGGEYPFGEYTFPVIAAGSAATASIAQAPAFQGEANIIARVDPDNEINETNELNNQNGQRVLVSPTFQDIAGSAGIFLGSPSPEGRYSIDIIKADINRDGYEDIYIFSENWQKLFLNNGTGTFSDITAASHAAYPGVKAAAFGDINNDGYPDLCLGVPGGNKLLLNNKDETFTDITASSGIGGRPVFTQIMFGDVNNDGHLDLYVITENSTNILFINNTGTSFTDETTARGLDQPKVFNKKPVFVDYDNDGDLDLLAFKFSIYYPTGRAQLFFYINDGTGVFSEKNVIELVSPAPPPWYTNEDFQPEDFAVSDIDSDGDLDLVFFGTTKDAVCGYLVRYYKNDGSGKFELVTKPPVSTRIYGYTSHRGYFCEIDNLPGEDLIWEKYFIGNSDKGTFKKYEDISYGRSPSFGSWDTSVPIDIDGDGDNDIIRIAPWRNSFFVQVLQNQINNNNWLKVRPVGVVSNRDAIGARVYVYSSGNDLVGFQEVSCEKPAPLHFGVDSLGTYKVVVRWPASGTTSTIENVSPAQTINVIEGGALPTPPETPSALTATAISQSQINLTWRDNSGNENCFKIERGTDGVNFGQIATVGRNLTAYSDNPLIPGTTYYYRVRAYNIGGDSAYSNISRAMTLPSNRPPVLDPIGNKKIDEGATLQFNVSATDPDTGDHLTFPKPSDLPFGANFTDNDNGTATFTWTPDYYQAGTYSATFTVSDGSLTDCATITITVNNVDRLFAPIFIGVAGATSTEIPLVWWDTSDDEDGFELERSTDGSKFSLIATLPKNGTPYQKIYTDTKLTPNTTYYYKMRAHNKSGYSAYSANYKCATSPVPRPPAAPSNLSAKPVSPASIKLTWNDNSDNEAMFEVERSLDDVYFVFAGVSAQDKPEYIDYPLDPVTKYYYRVRAMNYAGVSTYSYVAYAVTLPSLGRPSNLTAAAVSKNQIDLSWRDNASDEDGFAIERSSSGQIIFKEVARVGKDVTKYSDSTLSPYKTYDYRVRAYRNDGWNSEYSNWVYATTPSGEQLPWAPSNLRATSITRTEVGLVWTNNAPRGTGIYLIRIYRADETDRFMPIRVIIAPAGSVPTTSLDTVNLLPGKAYKYKVCAVINGVQSDYSNTIEVAVPRK